MDMNSFGGDDIAIIQSFDIEPAFLTDAKLQRIYNNILYRQSSNYAKKLNDAYMFIPKIKEILKEKEIPMAFLYLAMAESEFSLGARSSKKAVGLWQFMPRTATLFGLENNLYIDERRDFVKSTYAAVNYLSKLHGRFGKWYLATLSYNCGAGRVIEAITRATLDLHCDEVGYKVCRQEKDVKRYRHIIKRYTQKRAKFRELNKVYKAVRKYDIEPTLSDLLKVQKRIGRQYLPSESRKYIRKILSYAIVMNHRDFLMNDDNAHLLNRGISSSIAKLEVKGGVHLKSIAKLVGFDYQELVNLNKHLKRGVTPYNAVNPKKLYNVYVPYSRLARFNANEDKLVSQNYMIYTVKRGDTLWDIGREFKIPHNLIKKYNKLKSSRLRLKQQLIIPVFADDSNFYIVKDGDTLSNIASRYNVSLSKIIKKNNLKTVLIKAGDRIVLPH